MQNPEAQRTLWRATAATKPHFGFTSNWTDSLASAEQWSRSVGFGGPDIYSIEVDTGNVLDLRTTAPWATMLSATGCDESYLGPEENGHDALHYFAKKIAARGFTWIVHWQFGDHRFEWKTDRETWIYLGEEDLHPTFVHSARGRGTQEGHSKPHDS